VEVSIFHIIDISIQFPNLKKIHNYPTKGLKATKLAQLDSSMYKGVERLGFVGSKMQFESSGLFKIKHNVLKFFNYKIILKSITLTK